MEDFIQEQGITLQATRAPENPDMQSDPKWAAEASHWRCRFFAVLPDSSNGFTCYFSQGSAFKEPPTAADVLGCLAGDVASVQDGDFEEWAAELGYDPDSRRAHATWEKVKSHADQIEEWLGENAFRDFLEVEAE